MGYDSNKKKVLITGGVGFIGHHLIEHILKNTQWDIVTIDRLDTSGNINRLTDIECWEAEKHRVKFYYADLRAELNDSIIRLMTVEVGEGNQVVIRPFDYIIHLAAGSHVDRSITDPIGFFLDNTMGTVHLLDAVRNFGDLFLQPYGKFLYFSTDEVFGPAPEGVSFKEFDRFNPNNPYAAAKAGGEVACDAYANTYKIPVVVTHCMNAFGERQHPEKFVPLIIKKVLNDEVVTIHANKDRTKSGTRFYLHTRNICDAVLYILEHGQNLDGHSKTGKYNIVGEREVSNLEMAELIAKHLGKELKYEMVDFHSSRPGHDLRYALDGQLLHDLGWIPPVSFEDSLNKTIDWTLEHKNKWLL